MGDWQPIETAPKDGTPILVYEEDWGYPISIRWHQPWQKWVLNGVLLDLGSWGQPQIWMPLPEPPITIALSPSQSETP